MGCARGLAISRRLGVCFFKTLLMTVQIFFLGWTDAEILYSTGEAFTGDLEVCL